MIPPCLKTGAGWRPSGPARGLDVVFRQRWKPVEVDRTIAGSIGAGGQDANPVARRQVERQFISRTVIQHVGLIAGRPRDDDRAGFAPVAGGLDPVAELAAVDALLTSALAIRRTFSGDPAMLRERKRLGEQRSGQVGPDLSLWYDVQLPAGRANLAGVINALNALPSVEIAHPSPIRRTQRYCELHGAWT